MRGEMNHHGMRGWPRMGVGWSLMISCARATRTLRMWSLDARSEGQSGDSPVWR